MNGHTTGIDGCHSCWGNHHHAFGGFLPDLVKKSSFSGTGFSGQKDVLVRIAHIVEGEC
jgi:hypothetical protein